MTMSHLAVCLIALVLLTVPVNAKMQASVLWDYTVTHRGIMTGPSIVWKYLYDGKKNFDIIKGAIEQDIYDRLISTQHACYVNLIELEHVNDTGFFLSIQFGKCTTEQFRTYIVNASYPKAQGVVNKMLETKLSNLSVFWGDTVTTVSDTYLLPGVLSPLPPGVIANTTNKQTVMLSGDDTLWSKLVANAASVRAAIELDFASALFRSGVAMNCTVDSLAPRPADPTKMLPGDGNSGLTVNVTITQDILYETSNHPYDMHAMSAVLMSASMTNTSALYNDDHDGQTAPVKVVAAYEDMVYSPLDCESLCIVALAILVSVVYLMVLVAIVTVIATQCYLIKDFEFADVLHDDWRIFTTL